MSVKKITVKPGSTIKVAVSEGEHPKSGVLVEIEGNPRGFIPFSLLGCNPNQRRIRYAELITSPGSEIEVVVEEAGMHTPEATEGKPKPQPRPRIILNAQKAYAARVLAVREQDTAHLRQLVEDLNGAILANETPVTMQAVVTGIAAKRNKNGGGQHTYGVWVELENGVPALLHKSQMTQDHATGDEITVVVKSAEMNGSRAKVGVSEVSNQGANRQAVTQPVRKTLKPGIKTTGTDIRRATVASKATGEGIDGFTMEIDGVKAFLPLKDVSSNPDSLLKGNRSAKVWVTPLFLSGYVLVTRNPRVGEVIAEVEGLTSFPIDVPKGGEIEQNEGLNA